MWKKWAIVLLAVLTFGFPGVAFAGCTDDDDSNDEEDVADDDNDDDDDDIDGPLDGDLQAELDDAIRRAQAEADSTGGTVHVWTGSNGAYAVWVEPAPTAGGANPAAGAANGANGPEMVQIDPPALTLDAGPATAPPLGAEPFDSVIDELQPFNLPASLVASGL